MRHTIVECSKCHRVNDGNEHWASFTVKSSHYEFDAGTVSEVTEVDLCVACKKLLNGFLNNCEYTIPEYKAIFEKQGCHEKVNTGIE